MNWSKTVAEPFLNDRKERFCSRGGFLSRFHSFWWIYISLHYSSTRTGRIIKWSILVNGYSRRWHSSWNITLRAVFDWKTTIAFASVLLYQAVIGLRNSSHFFKQWEVKLNQPLMSLLPNAFPLAWVWLKVFASSSNWFMGHLHL